MRRVVQQLSHGVERSGAGRQLAARVFRILQTPLLIVIM